MTHYVNKEGKYLGVFEKSVPKGSIEVENAPQDKRQLFINGDWQSLDEKITAVEEIVKLESMLTPRALREAKRTGQPVKGYDADGNVVCEDVEAEIERLERDVLGR